MNPSLNLSLPVFFTSYYMNVEYSHKCMSLRCNDLNVEFAFSSYNVMLGLTFYAQYRCKEM